MGEEGNEHGERIEEEISQECTYAAYEEGTGRVKDESGSDDDHVVQIEVAAGDRNAEGRKGDVHGHEETADGEPPGIMGDFAVKWWIFLIHSGCHCVFSHSRFPLYFFFPAL